MLKSRLCIAFFAFAVGCAPAQKPLTDYVNPMLGTATLWDSVDLGFKPTKRTWGAEVFPGSSLPNAMVQVSPVTKFHSGAGYQYEDSVIYGFTHTNKGHWNLCHIPLLPVTGTPTPGDYCSPFSHERESAAPGYYQVFLDRYGVDAQLSSTLRCAFHKYTYPAGAAPAVLADLQRSNEHVRAWDIRKEGDNVFAGWQQTGEKMYFYAVANRPVTGIEPVVEGDREVRIVRFGEGDGALELRIGFSFVSEKNARENLEAEMLGKSFAEVRAEATVTWNDLLGRIRVEGGTEREKGLFYSSLYRSFLWPALRSDVNGEYMGADFRVHRSRSKQYTSFSNWDTYRTQIQLLSMLAPDVASDVVLSHQHFAEQSGGAFPRWVMANIETGIMQGDPTPILIANAWAFGAQDYDPFPLFQIMRRNAEVPGAKSQDVEERPGLKQYLEKGYYNASEQLEYTSSDFAIGQFALHACGDEFASWRYFHYARSWKNLYNPQTGWLQSRNADGSWKPLGEDWRESTYKNYFWMVPYDLAGLIETMGGKAAAEKRLDEFFVRLDAGYNDPWFASGNEPSFHIPWVYNWLGRPDKTSKVINRILNEQYTSAPDGLPGNDDLGTMGAWYVFACTGLYPMIPGVGGFTLNTPIFDKVVIHLKHGDITITGGSEKRIYTTALKLDGKPYGSTWIGWDALRNGATLEYTTSAKPSGNWGRTQLPPSYE